VTEDDGTSRGYGFVQFEKVEDSAKALEASKTDKDQFKVLGENLVVENFVPRRLRANNANDTYTNIYVKYIGKKFTTDDLVKMFEPFGKITSPVVVMNPTTNESRCFAFVNFESTRMLSRPRRLWTARPSSGRMRLSSALSKRVRTRSSSRRTVSMSSSCTSAAP
jgi:RNA recognition motif-containing protein